MKSNKIPERAEVSANDKWDLSSIYKSCEDWEKDLSLIPELAKKVEAKKGLLSKSSSDLKEALDAYKKLQMISEKTGHYASLLTSEDAGNSSSQEKLGKYMMTATEAEALLSFFEVELQEINEASLKEWMKDEEFAEYRVYLSKLLRMKEHILSEKEEKILALQSEANQTAEKAFSMLTNADMDFGFIKTEEGEKPLSQEAWSGFMESDNREIRKSAYKQFYRAFDTHKNTIAALYAGNVNLTVFKSKCRGYKSSLQRSLFPDNVSESVYRNLIDTVRSNFAPLHKLYSLRKKILKLSELRHYDVYASLVSDVKKVTKYDDAVTLVGKALAPLGKEYVETLTHGLRSGWVDKYENKGKRSGAFSSGGYEGYPYILLNYNEEVLRDVFTMAHEGGHSMHSWYSVHSNPFMQYDYTIFEAEVASTFNEELLFQYMLNNEQDEKIKIYLLCMRANDIIATLYRQTMFAEFELKTHEAVEGGIPLTLDFMRSTYRKLLEDYFGPEMVFEEESDLECLRIPHFYTDFYVYKYATGISAALALSERVLNGGKKELDDYFAFLKSGGSRYPIEALKVAGVNMEEREPVEKAIRRFSEIVDKIEAYYNEGKI